jgi:hypothetical protein
MTKKQRRHHRSGRLESVKRHRRWQAKLNKKQFFDQVFGPEA